MKFFKFFHWKNHYHSLKVHKILFKKSTHITTFGSVPQTENIPRKTEIYENLIYKFFKPGLVGTHLKALWKLYKIIYQLFNFVHNYWFILPLFFSEGLLYRWKILVGYIYYLKLHHHLLFLCHHIFSPDPSIKKKIVIKKSDPSIRLRKNQPTAST